MDAASQPAVQVPLFSDEIEDDFDVSDFALKQYLDKYAWKDENEEPTEVWPDTAYRVVRHVLGALGYTDRDPEFKMTLKYTTERKFIPGGRYLANAGKQLHQVNNCTLYRAQDSREGWMELVRKCGMSLMLGAGVGVVYSDVRCRGSWIRATNGIASGAVSLMQMVNEVARHIMNGGNRRSAVWAGLHWNHGDIFELINIKDWPEKIKQAKNDNPNNPAPLDMTNVSVILDDDFFKAYHDPKHAHHDHARKVYYLSVKHMLRHGEPGFSIDVGENTGENLRNACTEITSHDDSDICNLGSVNMARIKTPQEFDDVVKYATLFLLAGSVYSDIPHEEIKLTREKNRRLGLGLMGLHEWLLQRGYRYEWNDELEKWSSRYEEVSDFYAEKYAKQHRISVPVKKRAIAPNGTIALAIAETTQGIEPIIYTASKRRFLDHGQVWRYQYIVSPTAVRIAEENGIYPDEIETSVTLSYDPERRVRFQAEMQRFVDHGISSTINLPYPVTDEFEINDFAKMLIQYLPKLRGITCYPDGARGGQPYEPVPYDVAKDQLGVTFEDTDETCKGGICGV